jgi:hypothetical protein
MELNINLNWYRFQCLRLKKIKSLLFLILINMANESILLLKMCRYVESMKKSFI